LISAILARRDRRQLSSRCARDRPKLFNAGPIAKHRRSAEGRIGRYPALWRPAKRFNAASFVLPISNPASLAIVDCRISPLGSRLAQFALPFAASASKRIIAYATQQILAANVSVGSVKTRCRASRRRRRVLLDKRTPQHGHRWRYQGCKNQKFCTSAGGLIPMGNFGARKTALDLAVRFEPLTRLRRPNCSGACRPALRGIIMKQFFFAVALTFALAAGAVTVLTVQLTRAAAQTLTFGVGTLTGR
jgi:hypothetical protein